MALVPVSGQAGAGNGAGGSAVRGQGQACPRVSTVTRAHALACCTPNRPPRAIATTPRASSAYARSLSRSRAGRASGSSATPTWMPAARSWLASGGPGGSSRASALRDGRAACDEPVPAPPGGGHQGLADQAGGVGAARQQAGVEDHVGDIAAGAPGPVLGAPSAARCPARGPRAREPHKPTGGHGRASPSATCGGTWQSYDHDPA